MLFYKMKAKPFDSKEAKEVRNKLPGTNVKMLISSDTGRRLYIMQIDIDPYQQDEAIRLGFQEEPFVAIKRKKSR